MTRTREPATDRALTPAERRHLLRRLAFAATPTPRSPNPITSPNAAPRPAAPLVPVPDDAST